MTDHIKEYIDEDIESYICTTKQIIDNLLLNNDYQNAFNMLVIVIEKLNNTDRDNFINYFYDHIVSTYSKKHDDPGEELELENA